MAADNQDMSDTSDDADNTRQVWQVTVLIEATPRDKDAAMEAIERALCPDPDHPGYCRVAWFASTAALTELDDDERASWQEMFDDDRAAAARVEPPEGE